MYTYVQMYVCKIHMYIHIYIVIAEVGETTSTLFCL